MKPLIFLQLLLLTLAVGACSRSEKDSGSQTRGIYSPQFGMNLLHNCRAFSALIGGCEFSESELVPVQPYESDFTIRTEFVCTGRHLDLGFRLGNADVKVPFNSVNSTINVTGIGPLASKNFDPEGLKTAKLSKDCRFIVTEVTVQPSAKTLNTWRERRAELVKKAADASQAKEGYSELVSLKQAFAVLSQLNDTLAGDLARNQSLRQALDSVRRCPNDSTRTDCNLLKKIMFSPGVTFSIADKQLLFKLEEIAATLPPATECLDSQATRCTSIILGDVLAHSDREALSRLSQMSMQAQEAETRFNYFSTQEKTAHAEIQSLDAIAAQYLNP